MRGRCSGPIPEPVSATATLTPPPLSRSTDTLMRPPGGVWRSALSNRFVKTWRSASGSAVTPPPAVAATVNSTRASRARSANAAHAVRVVQNGAGEALGFLARVFRGERFGVPGDGGEGRLEFVGHIGDEVPADGFQPP